MEDKCNEMQFSICEIDLIVFEIVFEIKCQLY